MPFLRRFKGPPFDLRRCDANGVFHRAMEEVSGAHAYFESGPPPPGEYHFHLFEGTDGRLRYLDGEEPDADAYKHGVSWPRGAWAEVADYLACRNRCMTSWVWGKLLAGESEGLLTLAVTQRRSGSSHKCRTAFVPESRAETSRVGEFWGSRVGGVPRGFLNYVLHRPGDGTQVETRLYGGPLWVCEGEPQLTRHRLPPAEVADEPITTSEEEEEDDHVGKGRLLRQYRNGPGPENRMGGLLWVSSEACKSGVISVYAETVRVEEDAAEQPRMFVVRESPSKAVLFEGPGAAPAGVEHGLSFFSCANLAVPHKLYAVYADDSGKLQRHERASRDSSDQIRDRLRTTFRPTKVRLDQRRAWVVQSSAAAREPSSPGPVWWFGDLEPAKDHRRATLRRTSDLQVALAGLMGVRLEPSESLEVWELRRELGVLTADWTRWLGNPTHKRHEAYVRIAGERGIEEVSGTLSALMRDSKVKSRVLLKRRGQQGAGMPGPAGVTGSPDPVPLACAVHVRVSFGSSFPECQRTVVFERGPKPSVRDMERRVFRGLQEPLPPAGRFQKETREVVRAVGNYDVEYRDGTPERALPPLSDVQLDQDRVTVMGFQGAENPRVWWASRAAGAEPPRVRLLLRSGATSSLCDCLHRTSRIPDVQAAHLVYGDHCVFERANNRYHHNFREVLFTESLQLTCSVDPPVCDHVGGDATLGEILTAVRGAVDFDPTATTTREFTVTMDAREKARMPLERVATVKKGALRGSMVGKVGFGKVRIAQTELRGLETLVVNG